jgi:hypothetical protein
MKNWLVTLMVCLLLLVGCIENETSESNRMVKEHSINVIPNDKKESLTKEQMSVGREETSAEKNSESEQKKDVIHDQREKKSSEQKDSSSENKDVKGSQEVPTKKDIEKKGQTTSTPEVKKDSITISISGKDNKIILKPTKIPIKSETTVLDILFLVGKEMGIPVSVSGRNSTAYVDGINNLFEFDYGPMSGWVFTVNDKVPTKSAGIYYVVNGDEIRWAYTENLGKDVD